MNSKTLNKTVAIVFIAAAVVGALYAFDILGEDPRDPNATVVIRIGSFSSAIDYAPFIVARQKKWFEEAVAATDPKYQIEYFEFQTLPSVNEAIASGNIDFVFEAAPPALIGAAAGIDLRIVAVGCTLQQEIVVPTDSPITSPKDLQGKAVAVLAGTSSHYGLLHAVSADGGDPSKVRVLDLVPPDARASFETGQVAAWAVWPPWVEQLVLAGKGRVIKGGDAVIHSILCMRAGVARSDKSAAKAIVDTVERAKTWIQANPDEAQEIVANRLKIKKAVVDLAWPKHDWAATINTAIRQDLERKSQFLLDRKLIRKPVDVTAVLRGVR